MEASLSPTEHMHDFMKLMLQGVTTRKELAFKALHAPRENKATDSTADLVKLFWDVCESIPSITVWRNKKGSSTGLFKVLETTGFIEKFMNHREFRDGPSSDKFGPTRQRFFHYKSNFSAEYKDLSKMFHSTFWPDCSNRIMHLVEICW